MSLNVNLNTRSLDLKASVTAMDKTGVNVILNSSLVIEASATIYGQNWGQCQFEFIKASATMDKSGVNFIFRFSSHEGKTV
jgi:hypothetical protein